jgi:hypothetical protein
MREESWQVEQRRHLWPGCYLDLGVLVNWTTFALEVRVFEVALCEGGLKSEGEKCDDAGSDDLRPAYYSAPVQGLPTRS